MYLRKRMLMRLKRMTYCLGMHVIWGCAPMHSTRCNTKAHDLLSSLTL